MDEVSRARYRRLVRNWPLSKLTRELQAKVEVAAFEVELSDILSTEIKRRGYRKIAGDERG